MARKIVVMEYNSEWPRLYQQEADRLRGVFGGLLAAIHHIGSTSVPGLAAKPTIDIMPVVWDIERVDAFNGDMRRLGYQPRGEWGLPGRRYFCKGGDNRTHHVHIWGIDDRLQLERHLAVRDYLREHPAEAREYGELKAALALEFPEDPLGYMDAKDEFVRGLEQRALYWAGVQGPARDYVTWYHGSPFEFASLRSGSTLTPFRDLARVFSHKPTVVSAIDVHHIRHNGTRPGYLYVIDEPLARVDVIAHPNTVMEAGWEWLTTREVRVRRLGVTEPRENELMRRDTR